MGFNYRAHAREFGTKIAAGLPAVFIKLASSVIGPYGAVKLV
jgi:2-keto-4-pentenoate hydratase/2-oxohepta-3-ene-1,7-dioic acid hydratase in catechol pathway